MEMDLNIQNQIKKDITKYLSSYRGDIIELRDTSKKKINVESYDFYVDKINKLLLFLNDDFNPFQVFITLPQQIIYNGIEFELLLINNGDEARLCYIVRGDFNGHQEKWENPFFNNEIKGFLYLVEGITNVWEFSEAVNEMKYFLISNKIINE